LITKHKRIFIPKLTMFTKYNETQMTPYFETYLCILYNRKWIHEWYNTIMDIKNVETFLQLITKQKRIFALKLTMYGKYCNQSLRWMMRHWLWNIMKHKRILMLKLTSVYFVTNIFVDPYLADEEFHRVINDKYNVLVLLKETTDVQTFMVLVLVFCNSEFFIFSYRLKL